jgi:hypothetical protein
LADARRTQTSPTTSDRAVTSAFTSQGSIGAHHRSPSSGTRISAAITARLRDLCLAAAGAAPSSGTERQLKAALGNLLALAEAYPDLKASANFQALQRELADVADKLAAARRALNAAAARFNAARESFPAILFAGVLGFAPADFHRLDDSEQGNLDQTPRVAF